MKFCSKCGNELLDDAAVCMKCGCAVDPAQYHKAAKTGKKGSKKKIIVIIIAVIAAIGLAVGAFFLINYLRAVKVVKDLSYNTYIYKYTNTLTYDYDIKSMVFDGEGVMTYSYYFSSIANGNEYRQDYKIKFRGNMIILETALDEYEVQYDKYGKIVSLYDINLDQLYE